MRGQACFKFVLSCDNRMHFCNRVKAFQLNADTGKAPTYFCIT